MRCGEAKNWLSMAHDACLPPDRTLPLERHLEACSECRGYRDDLRLASRLLRATEPRLAENFEWRLSVRLNQRLAAAARHVPAPWERARTGGWWGRFGLGAATGVLTAAALGLWVLPDGPLPAPVAGPAAATVAERSEADRLPLDATLGGMGARLVNYGTRTSLRGEAAPGIRGWSGGSTGDLQAIVSLRQDNQRLRAALVHAQLEVQTLKAQRQREMAAQLEPVLAPDPLDGDPAATAAPPAEPR